MKFSKYYKRYLLILLAFYIVGLFKSYRQEGDVNQSTRPVYVKIIRTGLKVEQEFLAAKAARENRLFEAVAHRWVAATAASEDGFNIFSEKPSFYNDETFSHLFLLPTFEQMYSVDSVQRGERVVEGINRGKLAASLELIGENTLAEVQWGKAQSLMNITSIEGTKSSVYGLLKQEETSLHLKVEATVLGDTVN